MKKAFILFLCLLLICPSALAAKKGATDTWICLNCGEETEGNACAVCGKVRGAWSCSECGTWNLSNVCTSCGKKKNPSIKKRAADPVLLAALPSVRYLAAAGDAASLFRMGQYYEKGTRKCF